MSHVRTVAIVTFGTVLLSAGAFWFTVVRGESTPAQAFLSPGETDDAPLSSATPTEIYTDERYGFSFEYPSDCEITEEDNFDERVLFGDTIHGETRLLIVASPYLFDVPLTEDFLPLNIADVSSPVDSVTLASGPTALLFRRTSTTIGPTFDALFVHDDMLYQVTVNDVFEDVLHDILNSWSLEPAVAP
jgi:hypothetical protein